MSLIVKGNWGAFGYSYGSSSRASNSNRASGSILFASRASVLVCKSGRDIGYGSRGGNSNIEILKIIDFRRLFLVRVIKPNRISSLIRSSLATNRFLFAQIYYISSLIIESRVIIIVRAPVFCYIYMPPH
jgi:hypothetical protein